MPRVLNPAGGVQDVSEEQARELLALPGYSVAGPSAPDESLAAGVLGAARGLTFGLSDVALTMKDKAGNPIVAPERLAEIKEQNAGASVAGELLGTAGPALLTGGSSLAAKGAARGALSEAAGMTLPGMVSRASQAVERGVLKTLGGTTVRTVPGLAEEAAKQIVSKGVGSMVEGAVYGVGNAVSEAALGDPKKVAEHVVADVGLSAMLGLGLGAAGGALSELAPVAVGAAKNAAGKRAGKAIDYIREKYPKIAPLFGVDEDNARLLVNNGAIAANNQEARDALVKSVVSAATDTEDTAAAMGKLLHSGVLDDAVKTAAKNLDPRAVYQEADSLLTGVEGIVAKMSDPAMALEYDPAAVARLRRVAERARTAVSPDTSAVRQELASLRSAMDPTGKRAGAMLTGPRARELLADFNDLDARLAAAKAGDLPQIQADLLALPAKYTVEGAADQATAAALQRRAVAAAKQAEGLTDIAKSPEEMLSAVRQLKKELDSEIPYKKYLLDAKSPGERAVIREALGARSALAESLHSPAKWGDAATLLARVDDVTHRRLKVLEPLVEGGGLFSKRKGLDAGPFASFEASPKKVDSLFRAATSPDGEKRLQDLAEYLDVNRDLVNVFRDVHAAVGKDLPGLDANAISAVLGKTDEAVAEMRRTAAVQAAAKASAGPDTLGVAGRIGAGAAASALGMGTGGWALGTLWAAHGFLRKPTAVATTLYTLEQSSQRISKTIDNMARAVINGSVKAHYVGRGEAAAGLSKVFGEDRKKSEKRFQQRMERVNEMASNVPYQTEILSKSLSQEAQGHAPKVDGELKATTLRAVQVLAESLPRKERRGPLAGPPMYSQTEISKFTRIYEALETPVSVMKQLAAGTLTADTVSAVKRVYPELYAAMSESLLKYHIERGSTPQSRAMLSVFLGTDVDGSFRPVASAATAASYAGPPEKGGGKSSSPKSDLTVASRMQTPVGQIAEGEKA